MQSWRVIFFSRRVKIKLLRNHGNKTTGDCYPEDKKKEVKMVSVFTGGASRPSQPSRWRFQNHIPGRRPFALRRAGSSAFQQGQVSATFSPGPLPPCCSEAQVQLSLRQSRRRNKETGTGNNKHGWEISRDCRGLLEKLKKMKKWPALTDLQATS